MINVKMSIEHYNVDAMALEVEHISQLICKGYTSGEGWTLNGEEEKEPNTVDMEEEDEHKDDEELLDDILNNR